MPGFTCLHAFTSKNDKQVQVTGSVDIVPNEIAYGGENINDIVKQHPEEIEKFLFFNGVCTWYAGQLEKEIAQGKWFVVKVENPSKLLFEEFPRIPIDNNTSDSNSEEDDTILKKVREQVWTRMMLTLTEKLGTGDYANYSLVPRSAVYKAYKVQNMI